MGSNLLAKTDVQIYKVQDLCLPASSNQDESQHVSNIMGILRGISCCRADHLYR